jgi:Rv0078B-related antitoxin
LAWKGFKRANRIANLEQGVEEEGTMESRIPTIEVVDDTVADVLRNKSVAERLAIVDGLRRLAREVIRANVAREHPEWSEAQFRRQVARRMWHGAA